MESDALPTGRRTQFFQIKHAKRQLELPHAQQPLQHFASVAWLEFQQTYLQHLEQVPAFRRLLDALRLTLQQGVFLSMISDWKEREVKVLFILLISKENKNNRHSKRLCK
jgi:hypothetical protein